MKVGLVIYGSLDTLSGGYLYDRKLVEYLRGQGDTVEIISLPWRNYTAHLMDNLHFRLPTGLRTLVRQTTHPKRTEVRAPDRPPFDIIIQDELNHPSLIAANAGKHPYPVISLVHHLRSSESRPTWQNEFYRLVEKKYLQSVDGFIFNSQTTKRAVNSLLESSKPDVVAYPPTDRFGEAISKKEIMARANSNELRILFVGNLIRRKGLQTLLDALAMLVDLPNRAHGDTREKIAYRLDIVGSLTDDPSYARDMQIFVRVNALSSVVTFHSSLDSEPLRKLFQQAHILVVPSSYEGFGIVYLEGMGFGLPAIGTSAGAAGEIIEDGKTGYLIQPNDAASLATRLSSLASDREILTHLSLNARSRYQRQPKWEQTAGQIREFLLKQIEAFSV